MKPNYKTIWHDLLYVVLKKTYFFGQLFNEFQHNKIYCSNPLSFWIITLTKTPIHRTTERQPIKLLDKTYIN